MTILLAVCMHNNDEIYWCLNNFLLPLIAPTSSPIVQCDFGHLAWLFPVSMIHVQHT